MRNFDAKTTEVGHNVYTINLFLKRKIKSKHLDERVNKTQHAHLKRSSKSLPDTDNLNTETWLKNIPFSSPVERFIFAIKEQEICTNYLVSKRGSKNSKSGKCRLCNTTN